MSQVLAQQSGENFTHITAFPEFLHIQQAVAYRAYIANSSFSKRLLDIVFTGMFFLFIFSWLFPIIALLIKLTSRGPVFFKQERTALNGQKIKKLVPSSGSFYDFKNVKELTAKFKSKLSDEMLDDAIMSFNFNIAISRQLEETRIFS